MTDLSQRLADAGIEDSREFGRRALAAWQAMSEYEQVAFILDLPYGMILHIAAITRKDRSLAALQVKEGRE